MNNDAGACVGTAVWASGELGLDSRTLARAWLVTKLRLGPNNPLGLKYVHESLDFLGSRKTLENQDSFWPIFLAVAYERAQIAEIHVTPMQKARSDPSLPPFQPTKEFQRLKP